MSIIKYGDKGGENDQNIYDKKNSKHFFLYIVNE